MLQLSEEQISIICSYPSVGGDAELCDNHTHACYLFIISLGIVQKASLYKILTRTDTKTHQTQK